jgi:hypothetical protein
MKKFCQMIFFCLLSVGLSGQADSVAEEYYNFLNSNKDLSYPESAAMYPLNATYYQAIPDPEYLNSFEFLDSVKIKYNLSSAEQEMLAKNGFVVTERLSYETFVSALSNIYFKDLPVMITTDMMLFALHASYDGILKKLEIDQLRPDLIQILEGLRNSYNTLVTKYEGYPELQAPLKDIDLYISIPLALLGKVSSPINPANTDTFNLINSAIASEKGFVEMPLFSKHFRILDFSQFKPRGHYTEIIETAGGLDSLSAYFRAMIWLGRMDFLLTPPPSSGQEPWSEEDIWRMNASGLLLDELIDISGTRAKLNKSEKTIGLLVGESDNLTPGELSTIRKSAGIENVNDILDSANYAVFKQELIASPESGQKILSDIFMVDPFSTTPDPLPVSFRLMGQRFILDSYFFSQLVYDRIIYEGEKIWRPLPSPLDAAFILGNNDALNLLQDEINTYKYGTQLLSLRKLTDLYDTAFWQQSLYNSWLSCLRQLNTKPEMEQMPFFLSSAAWQHEKLNTQLASWAQLRHDNLLYAKQSYTYSYIEPYPEFYKALSVFASTAGKYFNEIGADVGIRIYFNNMKTTCDTLSLILDKQISEKPLTEQEQNFLKGMYRFNDNVMCGEPFEDGWFLRLLYEPGKEKVVADVHTQPTDQWGNAVGHVLHVGTGKVNLGIFLAYSPAPEHRPMAFVGPVMSYYETVTNDFYRYNDKEWLSIFPDLPRPDWTSIYLISADGDTVQKGPELPYELVVLQAPKSVQAVKIPSILVYPNPAGSYLNIRNISPDAKIFLYDSQGRLAYQSINNSSIIDINSLATGIYILKIIDRGKMATTRIVKK